MKKEKVISPRMTEEEMLVRLKFFIGVCLAVTLIGIVFTVLYSIMFITQPLGAISPIDSKFFELIIPIATFLTGTLSGIMLSSPPPKREEPEQRKYEESREPDLEEINNEANG
jgi:hypothetical protein